MKAAMTEAQTPSWGTVSAGERSPAQTVPHGVAVCV
jgi:hypothetical protein